MAEDTVEQRLQASIAILREEMATKADFEVASATAVAGLGTKDDLAQLRRDIEAEFVGIARNVDIAALQRLVEQAIRNTADLRTLQNLQYQTLAMHVQPLAGVPAILGDIVGLLQRLVDRVEALENPSPQAE